MTTQKATTNIVALLAFAVCALPALARQASIQEQIEAVLQQAGASFARKDLKGCMAYYAADFQGSDIFGGHYNRQQAKQNLIKSMAVIHSNSGQEPIESVMPIPGGAVILSREHTVLHTLGQRTHKMHVLIFDAEWRKTWTRTSKGWQLRREKQMTWKVTKDGKVTTNKSLEASPAQQQT